MTEDVVVRYRNVPEEIIADVRALDKVSIGVSITHDRKDYFNATGGPSDIIIYIQEHATELIVNGLIVSSAYELLKASISAAWKKLVSYYKGKQSSVQPDKNRIELVFKLKEEKAVYFNLEGTLDETQISKITEQVFEYFQNADKVNSDFLNQDFKPPISLKPTIRVSYNTETGQWEPVNYRLLREDLQRKMDDASETFSG